MRNLVGRTAFVTGVASGIGLALGRALAGAGMNVMLADIEADALLVAVESLRGLGPGVRGIACDVADAASVEQAAEVTREAFGNGHVVCNNAGVAGGSGIEDISLGTWRWVLDVNLMGVVHGIRTFLPRIRAHGEGGHIVNTASMAGLSSGLGLSPYSASFVRTRIAESRRNRPKRYGPAPAPDWASAAGKLATRQATLGRLGLDPMQVAARVLSAIHEDELYVFTHTGVEWRVELTERFDAILAAMDRAAESKGI